MASANNHRKRSRRSHRTHDQAAGVRQRRITANSFHQKPVIPERFRGLFRRNRREPVKVVEGEIVDA